MFPKHLGILLSHFGLISQEDDGHGPRVMWTMKRFFPQEGKEGNMPVHWGSFNLIHACTTYPYGIQHLGIAREDA